MLETHLPGAKPRVLDGCPSHGECECQEDPEECRGHKLDQPVRSLANVDRFHDDSY